VLTATDKMYLKHANERIKSNYILLEFTIHQGRLHMLCMTPKTAV